MNVTRKFTQYKCQAIGLVKDEGGYRAAVLGEGIALATHMTKTMARKAIMEATGEKLPSGVEVKWEPVAALTYAMTQDAFMQHAQCIAQEDAEPSINE